MQHGSPWYCHAQGLLTTGHSVRFIVTGLYAACWAVGRYLLLQWSLVMGVHLGQPEVLGKDLPLGRGLCDTVTSCPEGGIEDGSWDIPCRGHGSRTRSCKCSDSWLPVVNFL